MSKSHDNLPLPRKPLKSELRSPWEIDLSEVDFQKYLPFCDKIQKQRWISIKPKNIKYQDLLKTARDEYLWIEDQKYYELEPDLALLVMFYKDTEIRYPIKIPWDQAQGKLNLQGIILPSAYARWLWALSEPDSERYRTRCFTSANQPLVEAAFKRLGCVLV